MLKKLSKYFFFSLLAMQIFWARLEVFAQSYTEYEVKAAYIFNFAKFIQFPSKSFESDNSPIILGIYGDDPFGEIIKNTFNKPVNGRPWVIKYINQPEAIGDCHFLFISRGSRYEINKITNITGKLPVITIGDNIQDFCFNGGVINFTPQYSKHQFEINNELASQKGISISSKLLILAKIIRNNEVKF